MSTSTNRLWAPSLVLVALLVAAAGVASASRTRLAVVEAEKGHAPEASVITEAQHRAYRFFNDGRADAGKGRGLFETDFFKAKPEPVKPPAPPAPTSREAVFFYRGLAAFSDGARVAYLALDGRSLTLAAGEDVTDGWRLETFDGERAILVKDAERVTLPFNRRAIVSVAIKP